MSKEKIIGDVNFALRKKNLKEGEHYTVEAKIGGGKKEAHVVFTAEEHLKEHKAHLEELGQRNQFTVVLNAA